MVLYEWCVVVADASWIGTLTDTTHEIVTCMLFYMMTSCICVTAANSCVLNYWPKCATSTMCRTVAKDS